MPTLPSILTVLNSDSRSITHDTNTEALAGSGSGSIELDSNPTRNYARDLMTEISNVRTRILPHLDQPRTSPSKESAPGAISIYSKKTNTALTELENIINTHQTNPNPNPSLKYDTSFLDQETFLKAEEAIDTFRHTQLKLDQRSIDLPKIPSVNMGLESIYQRGQNWLLSVSGGTDHADALLWQFTNSHLTRHGSIPIPSPSTSTSDTVLGTGGSSRQLWPPTSRTVGQTRRHLSPKTTFLGLGKRQVEFDGCTHSIDGLKSKHREWAIDELRGNEMSAWERELIGCAVTRSGGDISPLSCPGDGEITNLEQEGTAVNRTSKSEVTVVAGPSKPRAVAARGGKGKQRVL